MGKRKEDTGGMSARREAKAHFSIERDNAGCRINALLYLMDNTSSEWLI